MYRKAKTARTELAERAPAWPGPRLSRNLFLRGVAEDAVRLAKEYAAQYNKTLSQAFEEAARFLPEIAIRRDKQLADQRRWLDEVNRLNDELGLPELPKGTVVKWIREYRDG